MEAEQTSTEILTPAAYYVLVRGQIEHEDNLIGQRLSWFVASQSFLFTAYAIVTSNLKGGGSPWVNSQQHALFTLMPIVAIANCLLIYATILAGNLAMRNLRALYQTKPNEPAHTVLRLPPVQGYRRTQFLGQAGPLLLPPVFLVVWAILLVHGLA